MKAWHNTALCVKTVEACTYSPLTKDNSEPENPATYGSPRIIEPHPDVAAGFFRASPRVRSSARVRERFLSPQHAPVVEFTATGVIAVPRASQTSSLHGRDVVAFHSCFGTLTGFLSIDRRGTET